MISLTEVKENSYSASYSNLKIVEFDYFYTLERVSVSDICSSENRFLSLNLLIFCEDIDNPIRLISDRKVSIVI